MAWDGSAKPEEHGLKQALVPDRLLYVYDQPLLFTVRLGFLTLLAYKVDENDDDGRELFLVKQVEERDIARLVNSSISLRGAVSADEYWLVETLRDRVPTRTWKVASWELPPSYLPAHGLGLKSGKTRLPDTVTQADAFFSVRFTGGGFGKSAISFNLFKVLTDRFYAATIRLLRPEALAGLRGPAIFDLPLLEPKFSSLAVGIQEPHIDTALANDRNLARGIPVMTDLVDQTRRRREGFFEAFSEIASAASKGGVSKTTVSQHYMMLDTVAGLLPTGDQVIETTEFYGLGSSFKEHIFLDETTGVALRQAYEEASDESVALSGRIETINGPSRTFIISNSVTGRQCTCSMNHDWFISADKAGEIRRGRYAHVFGQFLKRPLRDKIWLQRPPIFTDQQKTPF